MSKKTVGLVLAGGGARGLAHIGVLKSFESKKIMPTYLMGVSMGAIVGALYAAYRDARLVEERLETFMESEEFKNTYIPELIQQEGNEDFWSQLSHKVKKRVVFHVAAYKLSMLEHEVVENAVSSILGPIKSFEDLNMPFACVATDLKTGEAVTFRSGDLHFAVTASASIPGYLPPVEYNGTWLVDGAVANNIPVNLMKKYYHPDIIVASNVSEELKQDFHPESIYELLLRTGTITHKHYTKYLVQNADLIIDCNVGHFPWFAYNEAAEIIARGEKAAHPQIDKLIQMTKKSGSLKEFIYKLIKK